MIMLEAELMESTTPFSFNIITGFYADLLSAIKALSTLDYDFTKTMYMLGPCGPHGLLLCLRAECFIFFSLVSLAGITSSKTSSKKLSRNVPITQPNESSFCSISVK